MDFRILGPLEVEGPDRGLADLGHAKQRTVLAVLLLHRNAAVSRDRLIDELWGESVPPTATKLVQLYVSHLRKRLREAGIDDVLRTQPPGYVAAIDAESADAARFERLVGRAQALRERGEVREAVDEYRQALALWRGPVLADLSFESYASNEVERLNEARLEALTERIDCELSLGREAQLVGELEALVAEEPFREGLRRQLMLALYRSGRQAEALVVYHDTRRTLRDQLGLEPSPQLRKLEQAILRQDTSLSEPVPTAASESAESPAAAAASQASVSPAPPREVRKTVTVLFSDPVASTRLGQQLDPEALRQLMSRYFEEMRAVLERHGGTVEKYVGDVVMAVFGVPALHEDDALRAVRAAAEMRERLVALNREFMRAWGIRLAGRIGVDTGEVIAGDPSHGHLFVTGEAINTAKHLEELAGPTDVLLGEATQHLVRDAVLVEPVRGIGKHGGTIETFRLLEVLTGASRRSRRFDSRLVDREGELRALSAAFTNAVTDRACCLFTVLGAAGVGKSRLVEEFLGELGDDVRVLRGRCPPYGEGITYWPVVEVLKQLDVPPLQGAAAAIRSLLGEAEVTTSAEEIAWAFRKTLEHASTKRPLVVVFDDIQWGEGKFLDLVEQVALLSSDATILLLCMARPELLDGRPAWPVTLRLEPLGAEEIEQLMPEHISGALRTKIARAAGGNPLFVEEMVAMAGEEGNEVVVPPSLQALLAARLDQLESTERSVLERAAVEGEIFHRGAVQALSLEETQLASRLASLVRKELIQPHKPQLQGEDGFQFRHLLIRDAAYDALPKAVRAELHEHFASWLEGHGAELVELDELLGYHLEQACNYRAQLGLPHDEELAAAARRRLTAAGRRADLHLDYGAAVSLLERAAELVAPAQIDVALETALVDALFWGGRGSDALRRAGSFAARASAAGDRVGELCGRIKECLFRTFLEPEGATEQLAAIVGEGLPVFEAASDDVALCIGYSALAEVENMRAQMDAALEAFERAAAHARQAGLPQEFLGWRVTFRFFGTTPVSELLAWLDEQEPRGVSTLSALYDLRRHRALSLAMLGDFDEARAILADLHTELADRGGGIPLATLLGQDCVLVELLAADPVAAVERGEEGCRLLDALGEKAYLSTCSGNLAQALYSADRLEEANSWAVRAAKLGASDDMWTQMLWRRAKAKVFARRGEHAEAERLAREAVAIGERTDMLNTQGDAHADLFEVLLLGNKADGARVALKQALARYERKGNVVMAERTRDRLAALREKALDLN